MGGGGGGGDRGRRGVVDGGEPVEFRHHIHLLLVVVAVEFYDSLYDARSFAVAVLKCLNLSSFSILFIATGVYMSVNSSIWRYDSGLVLELYCCKLCE